MTSLPDYISDRGHGEISYPVPLQINGVTAYGFVLKPERERLQRFVDSQLNAVSRGAVHYSACPFVIHVYLDAEHATSSAETIGWLSDHESMFWVPVLQKRRGRLLPELKFWIPYLFIDQQAGMVTGREVWGYRKSGAVIEMPEGPDSVSTFRVATTIFDRFDAGTHGREAALLRLVRKGAAVPAGTGWTGFEGAVREIMRGLEGAGVGLAMLTEQVLSAFIGSPDVHAINLKQFRDAVDSTKACYQALVDSPCRLDRWKGGGMLPGEFELEITACDSHQIAADLGLGAAPPGQPILVRPQFAFWWRMDFSTQAGSIVWP
jgi:hypothetical protein